MFYLLICISGWSTPSVYSLDPVELIENDLVGSNADRIDLCEASGSLNTRRAWLFQYNETGTLDIPTNQ